MTTWITSDWHLGHKAIIDHCYRPFSNVNEMDDTIIRNYLSVVKEKDIVYLIGDFAWAAFYFHEVLPILPGQIFFILGNHDEKMRNIIRRYVQVIDRLSHVRINGYRVILSHYPLESWYGQRSHSYHLHGHLHGNTHRGHFRVIPRRIDVSVDAWKFKPASFEEILEFEAGRQCIIPAHSSTD